MRQIVAVLEGIRIPPEFYRWAKKWFRERHSEEVRSRDAVYDSQERTYQACVRKLDALIDMRAAGEITADEFAAKKSAAMQKKLRMEELLADTSRRQNLWLEVADDALTFARDAHVRFAEGSFEQRRRILAALGSNLSLIDRKLDFDRENSILALQEVASRVQDLDARFEPREVLENKGQIEHLYARCPTLLRGSDSNRQPTPYTNLAVSCEGGLYHRHDRKNRR